MKKAEYHRNAVYLLVACYLLILIPIGGTACWFAYQEKEGEILSRIDMTLTRLANEYHDITNGFWQIYMPVFENQNAYYSLGDYFSVQESPDLNALEKMELKQILNQMAARNDRIQWIAVISDVREINYIFFPAQSVLQSIPPDFPYLDDLAHKESQMEVFGVKEVASFDAVYKGLAISGGIPVKTGRGGILAGYGTGMLEQICGDHGIPLKTLGFTIEADGHHIFNYYPAETTEHVYSRFAPKNSTRSDIYCVVSPNELFFFYSANSFRISAFILFALIFISILTVNLKKNGDRAYYYELKQRDAELSELQTKFNPHFLYNSLEIFRARCQKNGDKETADLITQLAGIFRGFIGSKTFISIREELAFSKRYLALFQARYGESVRILYDIDTPVLQYGIIRNVFPSLIENYFIHGFDTAKGDNFIIFRGKIESEKTILISVEDNGQGMPEGQLAALNDRLREKASMEHESYGLKNLHQRLWLFYGDQYGIMVRPNEGDGLSVEIRIARMTCEEYDSSSYEKQRLPLKKFKKL
ncbi:hypothetical protein FACS189485_18810 [Spirochaetia bacterium]|nr:hypothetical protein FACS189485_18810 [Spirochaetia bacterium]